MLKVDRLLHDFAEQIDSRMKTKLHIDDDLVPLPDIEMKFAHYSKPVQNVVHVLFQKLNSRIQCI
jgi:hypothetical protein